MSARGCTGACEANVSIYILALALSRVLSARVYSRHNSGSGCTMLVDPNIVVVECGLTTLPERCPQ